MRGSAHLHDGICGLVLRQKLRLFRGFLGLRHNAALILSALRAGAVGKLLLVAVRTLREARRGQKVVSTAIGSAARRVAPFRIRHNAVPFVFQPGLIREGETPGKGGTLKISVLRTSSCCEARKVPPSGGPSDPLRRSIPDRCGSG